MKGPKAIENGGGSFIAYGRVSSTAVYTYTYYELRTITTHKFLQTSQYHTLVKELYRILTY